MVRKLSAALASSAVVLALTIAGDSEASAAYEGHHQQVQQHAAKHARRRVSHRRISAARRRTKTKARGKASRLAAGYTCPMHPDIREKAPGTCPKCGMNLVRERDASQARQ